MHNNRNNKMSERRSKPNERHLSDEQENRQFGQMFKKLYLSTDVADVYFVFDIADGETERVPAHKFLLLAASEGFKKLFDAAEDGQTDFKLDGITAGVLKEFLQFFYLPKIKLTFDNIAHVMQLVKDYGNEDCMVVCCLFLEYRLTTENIIWGYDLAIRFDRGILKKYCEQKISESAGDVFRSTNFAECDRDVLMQILQIDAFKCNESQVLTSCLTWAKVSADKKGLNSKDTQVLHTELGDLLHQIRFKSITMESFSMIVGSYNGFFAGSELEEIIQMIVSKDFKSEKFNNKYRSNVVNSYNGGGGGGGQTDDRTKHEVLYCSRYVGETQSQYLIRKIEKTRFEANRALNFISFNCSQVLNKTGIKTNIPTKITITEEDETQKSNVVFTGETTLNSEREAYIPLCCAVPIQPNRKYEITMELDGTVTDYYNLNELKKYTELKNGTKIRFISDGNGNFDDTRSGLVTRLQFKRA